MPASEVEHVWFHGRYPTWAEARLASTGYDAPTILAKVREATLKVLAGEAAYERDSVAFDRLAYSFPVLACLLFAAAQSAGDLDVLDFGGALGSSYWQNRALLGRLKRLQWSVVEQPHFVTVGQQEIANKELRFYRSINECLAHETPTTALVSGVLQYLEDPFNSLDDILSKQLRFVIVDRTQCFVDDLPARITVERVHPDIHEASYPSWFFNLKDLQTRMVASGYRIIEEFDSWERWDVDGDRAQNKCFLLERSILTP